MLLRWLQGGPRLRARAGIKAQDCKACPHFQGRLVALGAAYRSVAGPLIERERVHASVNHVE